ncbi:MAG: outer membrane beta-barrel protein [Oleibacter sp.]|nr:outer membrane beta-barrel protein [Thalassolituus sp.]
MKFMKISLYLLTATFSISVYALEPKGIPLGSGTTFFPSIGISIENNDNVYLQPKNTKESSVITRVNPILDLELDMGSTLINTGIEIEKGYYTLDSNDDYSDFIYSVAADTEFSDRHAFGFVASYKKGHDDRGAGTAEGINALVILPDEYNDKNLGAAYTYGSNYSFASLTISADLSERIYTNNEELTSDREYSKNKLGALLSVNLSSATDILFEVRNEELDYISDSRIALEREASILTFLTGVSWDITGKVEGSIKLGTTKRDFNVEYIDDESGFSWEVDLIINPVEHSTLTLFTQQSSNETSGPGNSVDSTYSLVKLDHEFSVFFSLTAEASLLEDDYVNSNRLDRTSSYGFMGTYSPTRSFDVIGAIEIAGRDSSGSDLDLDYYSQIVSLGFALAI